jgi:hypothetical protein
MSLRIGNYSEKSKKSFLNKRGINYAAEAWLQEEPCRSKN